MIIKKMSIIFFIKNNTIYQGFFRYLLNLNIVGHFLIYFLLFCKQFCMAYFEKYRKNNWHIDNNILY